MPLSLIAELKRRNVIKVAGAYLALGWVVTEVSNTVVPMLHLPESIPATLLWIGLAGFPFVVMFSWVFELTPEGLKRESEVDRSQSITHVTSKRLDYIIIGLLVLAIGLFVLQYLRPPQPEVVVEAAAVQSDAASVTAIPAPAPQSSAAAAPAANSIAVLPFVNMSEDKANEYFSDGISEELLNLLARIPEMRVIARTSSFAFKGKEADIADIAKKLNVAHVLEGSVRKAGNTVRITAQLIRTSDSTHLWSDTWDRPLDNIFAVQDEIAAAVVAQLKIKLLGAAPQTRVVDPRAYALYLQGRQLAHQYTSNGYTKAITLYQQALVIDPGYAAAWEGLSRVYANQAGDGLRSIQEGIRLAREAVTKALALDPELALAHASLGWIVMNHEADLTAAALHYSRALALAPDDSEVLRGVSALAMSLGRLDTGVAILETLIARDPVNTAVLANLGNAYLAAGRPDAAIERYRTLLALSPGYITACYGIGAGLLLKNEPAAALAAIQQESGGIWRAIGLPLVWHALGEQVRSDAALAELIRDHEQAAAYNIAYVHAYRGEADSAFEWLDKAVGYRDGGLSEIVLEPLFANIHHDPRWLPFLRQLGKAPEQLAAIPFEVKLPH